MNYIKSCEIKKCSCVFCSARKIKDDKYAGCLANSILSVENTNLCSINLLKKANYLLNNWFCYYDCENQYNISCSECKDIEKTINKLHKISIISKIPLMLDISKICYNYL